MKLQYSSTLKVPLSGWGKYPMIESYLTRPEKISTLKQIIQSDDNPSLARGLGRSYGDGALNSEGYTISTERLNRMLAFDQNKGILRCESGVTIKEILEVFVPQGWLLAVTPGTKFVTVGGAIAFDVHGKNHHRDGSFCNHVLSFQLLLASGEIVKCSRQENSDLFWATVGGMGLTGIIIEAEFALIPIETAYINSHKIKAKNLEEAIALFTEYEPQYQYSVAWIDCLASGKSLGRSILIFGNHAAREDIPTKNRAEPLTIKAKGNFQVFFDLPNGVLNRYTMSSFNALYYGSMLSQQVKSLVDYDSFFYPLDSLGDWNRLYGKGGFVQYQCVFPQQTSKEAIVKILKLCSENGWGSFLAVLKRFGNQEGWLSFPMAGYTLALDIPIKIGLWQFLEQLDETVIHYGGRVYLAKDARLSPQAFRAMYPNFPQWLEVKSRLDPQNRFSSALSKRLQIDKEI